MAKFNLETPIKDIMANPAAREALTKVAPKLASNPMLTGMPMGLKQMAAFAGDKLPKDVLEKIESALSEVE